MTTMSTMAADPITREERVILVRVSIITEIEYVLFIRFILMFTQFILYFILYSLSLIFNPRDSLVIIITY